MATELSRSGWRQCIGIGTRGRALHGTRTLFPECDAAGLEGLEGSRATLHFSPHRLRHTFASLLPQQGESPAYVQRQLGHASIQLTVDTYGGAPYGQQGGG